MGIPSVKTGQQLYMCTILGRSEEKKEKKKQEKFQNGTSSSL